MRGRGRLHCVGVARGPTRARASRIPGNRCLLRNRRLDREEKTITHEQALLLVHGVIHACGEVFDRHNVADVVRDEIADALTRLTNARNIYRSKAEATPG